MRIAGDEKVFHTGERLESFEVHNQYGMIWDYIWGINLLRTGSYCRLNYVYDMRVHRVSQEYLLAAISPKNLLIAFSFSK
jgi:hypothetical protein